jgi:hypothetical protein
VFTSTRGTEFDPSGPHDVAPAVEAAASEPQAAEQVARLGALLGERVAEGAVGDEAVPPAQQARGEPTNHTSPSQRNWIQNREASADRRYGGAG